MHNLSVSHSHCDGLREVLFSLLCVRHTLAWSRPLIKNPSCEVSDAFNHNVCWPAFNKWFYYLELMHCIECRLLGALAQYPGVPYSGMPRLYTCLSAWRQSVWCCPSPKPLSSWSRLASQGRSTFWCSVPSWWQFDNPNLYTWPSFETAKWK